MTGLQCENIPASGQHPMRTSSTLLAYSMACLLCTPSARAQIPSSVAESQSAGIDSMVSAEFAKDSFASMTVGVIANSQLAWTRSYGFADMKTHRLANRATVYRVGSITKMFTAVMLMQLVEAGKIRLSDPVERYLPEVNQIGSKPREALPFTFAQLATMTAGLAVEPRQEGPFWTGQVADWEKTLFAALPHTEYISVPGTGYWYSNIGYAILGAALSRAAGVPYTEWERTHVFEPLGMHHTRFEIDSTIATDLATGYEFNDDGTWDDTTAAYEGRHGRGYKVPNGAIFTTVDDLARFAVFELGQGPPSVLPPARLESAYGGFVTSNDHLLSGYGLGFMVMRSDTTTWVGHSGAVAGYHAFLYFDRDMQVGVVVLRNAGLGKEDTGRLAEDIIVRLIHARRAEAADAFAQRFKTQTPAAGSEAALRRLIGELRLGTPDYNHMSAPAALVIRQDLTHTRATLAALGALQSLTFKGVGRGEADIYTATFEHGALEYRIWLLLDGRIAFVNDRPTT
jgi:CubicO group peptidase (beta-lactamase class C family)